MLKLDIGCGPTATEGFVGVDMAAGTNIVKCDIATSPLPFEDQSAEHVLSSHCLEHIERERLPHVLQQMTRVCAHGALIEIWHPQWSHSDAFVIGHVNYIGESIYDHLGWSHRDFWAPVLGARWFLQEIRYGIDPAVIEDMRKAGVDLDFAIRYYREVVREIGAFIRIERGEPADLPSGYHRSVCLYRQRTEVVAQLRDGP